MEKVEINLKEATEKLVLLKGEAVVEQKPKAIYIGNGTIGAASQFLKQKEEVYDKIKSHVVVNKEQGTIVLSLNEKDNNGQNDIVECALRIHPISKDLGLNTATRYGREELIDVIRKNRVHFTDKQKASDIIMGLRKFYATVDKKFEIGDDLKGNTQHKLETIVSELSFASTYELKIPIYIGQEKKTVLVEICVDSSQGNLRFYLQSDDLYEIIIEYREDLINEAIAEIKKFGCSIVEVY